MRLQSKVIDILQGSHAIRSKIGLLTEKHPMTIQLWVNKNTPHGPLLAWSVLSLISEETGIPVKELVEEELPIVPKSIIR